MSRFAHLRQRLAAILERLNAGDSETALRRWMHHGEAPHSPAQLRLVLEWEAFVIAARANTNGIDLEAGSCLRGRGGYVPTEVDQQDAQRLAARWALVTRAKAGDGAALSELGVAHRERGDAARKRLALDEAEEGGT